MTPNPRRKSPALYELVGAGKARPDPVRVRAREVQPDRQSEPADRPVTAMEGEFAAGGSVRMPAGALFFIIFGVLAALAAGYLIGYQQKAREVEKEQTREAINGVSIPKNDPLNDRPVNPDLLRSTPATADSGTQADSGGAGDLEDQPQQRPQPADSGPIGIIVEGGVEDPRQAGLNYYAITSMGEERVEAFLDHLVANGVDAAAYRVNNVAYRIYALRGFSREQFREERGPFEAAIKRIAEQFKDQSGRDIKVDPYWEKYTP